MRGPVPIAADGLARAGWQPGPRLTTALGFIGWSGARGQIQWHTPSSAAWHGHKDVYSTSTGTYSYTYTTDATREYRVLLNAVSTIWESTSPVVRR